MNTSINFDEIFAEAEANTPFDQLIAVLQTAQKRVKAERDRIHKGAETQVKFDEAAARVAELQPLLADDPTLIPDFLEAAAEMKKANNTRLSREEKAEDQTPAIELCLNEAYTRFADLFDTTNADYAEAA